MTLDAQLRDGETVRHEDGCLGHGDPGEQLGQAGQRERLQKGPFGEASLKLRGH